MCLSRCTCICKSDTHPQSSYKRYGCTSPDIDTQCQEKHDYEGGRMRIWCCLQALANPARDNHHGLSDPSRPRKLGRIPCRYAVLRIIVNLDTTHHPAIPPNCVPLLPTVWSPVFLCQTSKYFQEVGMIVEIRGNLSCFNFFYPLFTGKLSIIDLVT